MILQPVLSGGEKLPNLTNPGSAADLLATKQLIGQNGEIVNGSMAELTSAETALIQPAPNGLVASTAVVSPAGRCTPKQLSNYFAQVAIDVHSSVSGIYRSSTTFPGVSSSSVPSMVIPFGMGNFSKADTNDIISVYARFAFKSGSSYARVVYFGPTNLSGDYPRLKGLSYGPISSGSSNFTTMDRTNVSYKVDGQTLMIQIPNNTAFTSWDITEADIRIVRIAR